LPFSLTRERTFARDRHDLVDNHQGPRNGVHAPLREPRGFSHGTFRPEFLEWKALEFRGLQCTEDLSISLAAPPLRGEVVRESDMFLRGMKSRRVLPIIPLGILLILLPSPARTDEKEKGIAQENKARLVDLAPGALKKYTGYTRPGSPSDRVGR